MYSWITPVAIAIIGAIIFTIVIKTGVANRITKLKPRMEMGIEIPVITFVIGLFLGIIL